MSILKFAISGIVSLAILALRDITDTVTKGLLALQDATPQEVSNTCIHAGVSAYLHICRLAHLCSLARKIGFSTVSK